MVDSKTFWNNPFISAFFKVLGFLFGILFFIWIIAVMVERAEAKKKCPKHKGKKVAKNKLCSDCEDDEEEEDKKHNSGSDSVSIINGRIFINGKEVKKKK